MSLEGQTMRLLRPFKVVIQFAKDNIGCTSAIRILQRFGNWKIECEQSGVKNGQILRSKYQRNWTEEEMIQWFATLI
jgi:hypothetical protein